MSDAESSPGRKAHGSGLRAAIQAKQQHIFPHHLMSALMYLATRIRFRPWKNWQIRWFIRRYGVNMAEAEIGDPTRYPDFNTFFTRTLKTGARSFAADERAVLCPADGTVSQIGDIHEGTLLQAKGRLLTVERLLGRSTERAAAFLGGRFATIYLAPWDYHRVHMPAAGTLEEMVHVPGRLFSVNPNTTLHVSNLFGRNERVASLFQTPAGPMAVVLVGAFFVGSIEQVWSGLVTPTRARPGGGWGYAPGAANPPVSLARGDEMGRFNMGSTVVLLFAKDAIDWEPGLGEGDVVRAGQIIGHARAPVEAI